MIRSGRGKAPSRALPATRPDDVKAIDAMVLSAMPDRSHKSPGPRNRSSPNNRFGSAGGFTQAFSGSPPGHRGLPQTA